MYMFPEITQYLDIIKSRRHWFDKEENLKKHLYNFDIFELDNLTNIYLFLQHSSFIWASVNKDIGK